VEVGEGLGALARKSALYVSVYAVDRRSCVNRLRKCDIKMSGVGISRNLSVELHIVQRQVYDCYTAVKRQRKYAWPVQRETGSPHWRSFEITRKLSLMRSLPRNSCVVVVVNGSFDPGLCVVFGGVAKLEVSEGVRALDRKSACEVGRNYAKFEFTVVNDVENKESSCRLGAGLTHFDA